MSSTSDLIKCHSLLNWNNSQIIRSLVKWFLSEVSLDIFGIPTNHRTRMGRTKMILWEFLVLICVLPGNWTNYEYINFVLNKYHFHMIVS